MDVNVLFIVTGVLLLVGVPIHAAMLTASFVYFMFNPGISLVMVMQRVMGSMNSFVLIAVPFFIFAGQIMNSGGITKRIFSFSEKLVGHFRGGLGHVNVLASLIFSGGYHSCFRHHRADFSAQHSFHYIWCVHGCFYWRTVYRWYVTWRHPGNYT